MKLFRPVYWFGLLLPGGGPMGAAEARPPEAFTSLFSGWIVNLATGLSIGEGIIGFQAETAETAEIFYRNIRIKELETDLPLEEALQMRPGPWPSMPATPQPDRPRPPAPQ